QRESVAHALPDTPGSRARRDAGRNRVAGSERCAFARANHTTNFDSARRTEGDSFGYRDALSSAGGVEVGSVIGASEGATLASRDPVSTGVAPGAAAGGVREGMGDGFSL